jgi:hypothetical protein
LKPLGGNFALSGFQASKARSFSYLRPSLRKSAFEQLSVKNGLRSYKSFRTIMTDASPVTTQSSQLAWKKLGITAVSFYCYLLVRHLNRVSASSRRFCVGRRRIAQQGDSGLSHFPRTFLSTQ